MLCVMMGYNKGLDMVHMAERLGIQGTTLNRRKEGERVENNRYRRKNGRKAMNIPLKVRKVTTIIAGLASTPCPERPGRAGHSLTTMFPARQETREGV